MKTKRKSKHTLDAVVAGYLCLDVTPGFSAHQKGGSFSDVFRPGKLVETKGLTISMGGVVANTGLAMKRFGQKVGLMSCVGNDALGDMVMAKLHEEGETDGIHRKANVGTGYGIVLAPPGTDRMFFDDPGCNGVFTSADIDYSMVAQSRLFHFGYPPLMKNMWAKGGAELKTMFSRVQKLGVATALDMALPDSASPAGKADWQKILKATLPHVDIFLPSIEEILFMMDPKQYARLMKKARGGDIIDVIPQEIYDQLAERILAMGVKVVVIKAGHKGVYIRTGDVGKLSARTELRLPVESWSCRSLWIPCMPLDQKRMQNACGAGDCAVAGFLSAMLKGTKLEEAGLYAVQAGRDNLYGMDALSGLSDWKKMTAVVKKAGK